MTYPRERAMATLFLRPETFLHRGLPAPDRHDVERELGEEAALAWDDIQAAKASYWKAVNKRLKEKADG